MFYPLYIIPFKKIQINLEIKKAVNIKERSRKKNKEITGLFGSSLKRCITQKVVPIIKIRTSNNINKE